MQTRAHAVPYSASPDLPPIFPARALCIISQTHQAHTSHPILPSSFALLPSHLNTRPALLDSDRQLSDRARTRLAALHAATLRAIVTQPVRNNAAPSARHLPQGLALGIHGLGVQITAASRLRLPSSIPDLRLHGPQPLSFLPLLRSLARSLLPGLTALFPFLPCSRLEPPNIDDGVWTYALVWLALERVRTCALPPISTTMVYERMRWCGSRSSACGTCTFCLASGQLQMRPAPRFPSPPHLFPRPACSASPHPAPPSLLLPSFPLCLA
ncbi:hypothetical protein B0H14DRAFT_3443126 [Mycena olivaceomarginata]|nr:hypothetical protein B0H14DRAFT_3443126 [Mycena olivaceomarginata]